MMTDHQKAADALAEHYGSHAAMIMERVLHLSTFQQPCDITFYDRDPVIDVKISPKYGAAMMYGAGASKMVELFSTIETTSGASYPFNAIWIINPMPKEGLTADQLEAVDLREGDAVAGPNGETVRQMIAKTYRCKTQEATEAALRRFLAS